jgi:hypothetical protein
MFTDVSAYGLLVELARVAPCLLMKGATLRSRPILGSDRVPPNRREANLASRPVISNEYKT